VMSFGYGGGEVLHVHGVVVLCPSKGSPADEQARITREMEVAGGPWAASHGSEHQVELKPHYNPDYWGGTYLNRNRLEAEGVIARGRSWSMTNPARREAQRQYDQVRRQINGKPGPGDGSPNDGGPRKCTTPDTLSSEPFAERDRIAERRTLPPVIAASALRYGVFLLPTILRCRRGTSGPRLAFDCYSSRCPFRLFDSYGARKRPSISVLWNASTSHFPSFHRQFATRTTWCNASWGRGGPIRKAQAHAGKR
jgi:hypothetical protein